jgi:hypothetical protein
MLILISVFPLWCVCGYTSSIMYMAIIHRKISMRATCARIERHLCIEAMMAYCLDYWIQQRWRRQRCEPDIIYCYSSDADTFEPVPNNNVSFTDDIPETWWWITFKAICKSCRYAQLKTQSAMIMDCIIGSTLIECSDIILFGLARMKMKPRSGIYWLKPCLAVARHWLIDALLVVETKMSCWQYHLQQNELFTKQ